MLHTEYEIRIYIETELAELYPDLFEEYVHEGIQYAIACVDIDSIIAEIKENAWEAY